jgi:lipocalin
MKEYICKEDLINYINEGLNTSKFGHDGVEIMAEIEFTPPADVVEVVHGKWIETGKFDAHYSPIYQCSACYKEVADNYISCHKHCLHCGAKMDKEN